MPPKKKTSTKKKKKGKGKKNNSSSVEAAVASSDAAVLAPASTATAAPAPPPVPATPIIFTPEDELGMPIVVYLARKEMLDAKKFAKYLPSKAQELRDGAADPEKVALGICDHQAMRIDDTFEVAIRDLANITVDQLGETELCKQFYSDLDISARKSFQSARPGGGITMEKQNRVLAKAIKAGNLETFDLWEQRFDDIFANGRRGAFRLHAVGRPFGPSLSLEVYEAAFNEIEYKIASDGIDLMLPSLHPVCCGVAAGECVTMKTCWECDKLPPHRAAPLESCSRCQTAVYCSKQCQTKAWKSGHKHTCSGLKSKMHQFEQLIQEVDDMHEQGSDFHGLRLGYIPDYTISLNALLIPLDMPAYIDGPSMNIYYSNLERIVKGEWWPFGNPTKYEPKDEPEMPADMDDQQFGYISLLLTHDLIPYVEKGSGSSSYGSLDDVENHPTLSEAWVQFKAYPIFQGKRATASQYLAYYEFDCEVENFLSARNMTKAEVMRNFRKANTP